MDHPNPTKDFLTSQFSNDEPPRRKLERLTEYLAGIEAERRKIEPFKRELPLCLDLLNDAVERLREELKNCRQAVGCNFEKVEDLNSENDDGDDMKNWMSSVKLWNNHTDDSHHLNQTNEEENAAKEVMRAGQEIKESPNDEFLLINPVAPAALVVESNQFCAKNVISLKNGNLSSDESKMQKENQKSRQQVLRKHRRHWSPDLHRRFVDALQQLGGSEVATPKQIRDVMQVEGLTNAEVKSHLQKYRLHLRKSPSLSSSSGTSNGLTRSPDDHQTYVNQQNKSHTISPQGPLDRSAGSMAKCNSNNTMVDEDESEGHSSRNRLIFLRCMPTC
ncbi:unnamed protein product [Rhodiola kirilowii]